MILTHTFDNPQVNLSLELFLREACDLLGDQLLCVVVFGSILFDDLSPGYGDLDFLAVIENDPDEETIQKLIDLRKPLRSGHYGIYCHMIEGPFLPLRMLDPNQTGQTVCWGTGGERIWDRNKLGWFVHKLIRERGITIYGRDIRSEIPAPTDEQILAEVKLACRDIRERAGDGGLHSIDWLLLAARTLLWLREGIFTSKSGAADWAFNHAEGKWREHLVRARDLRKNPTMVEKSEVKEWLGSLSAPIHQACDELERELRILEV